MLHQDNYKKCFYKLETKLNFFSEDISTPSWEGFLVWPHPTRLEILVNFHTISFWKLWLLIPQWPFLGVAMYYTFFLELHNHKIWKVYSFGFMTVQHF